MTVRAVRTAVVELDNLTLQNAYGSKARRRRHLFVAVEAEDGTTGYGEGSPLPHFSGERADAMKAVVDEVFGPALMGADPFAFEAAQQRLDRALPKHQASKAAVVTALYDLAGKLAGRPVHALLGGPVRERLAIGSGVGIEDDATVLAKAEALWAEGVRAFKVKIGADIVRDARILRRLREALPPEAELRADANAGLSFADAARFLRMVEDVRLQYVEQPVAPNDLRSLARLRDLGTPVAVDESLYGLADALAIVKAEAADVFIVKLIKVGGLTQAKKVAAVAEAAGIRCVAVSPYETALGVAANLHLAAACPAFVWPTEMGVGARAVTMEGMRAPPIRDAVAAVPEGPGVGVTPPAALFA